jgi:hypothetical protein
VKLSDGAHKDSVFSINVVPREPYNMFVSGDCDDKCLVWKVVKDESVPQTMQVDGGAGALEEQKQATD